MSANFDQIRIKYQKQSVNIESLENQIMNANQDKDFSEKMFKDRIKKANAQVEEMMHEKDQLKQKLEAAVL